VIFNPSNAYIVRSLSKFLLAIAYQTGFWRFAVEKGKKAYCKSNIPSALSIAA
jgi:hypothetical protein